MITNPVMSWQYSAQINSLATIEADMRDVNRSIMSRSILWVVLRTVPEPAHFDESKTIARQTFHSEFQAATTIFHSTPQYDYTPFFANQSRANTDLDNWAIRFSRRVLHGLISRLNRAPIILPRVQRSKNTSYLTGIEMNIHKPSIGIKNCRTVDLEVFRAETGIAIGGAAEIRTAWKFNDLKPRAYYAQGGDMYWNSRFIRNFAVFLMESIPATQMLRRRDPQDYVDQDTSMEYLVTWDFTAFTSRLSELKFFLSAIAKGLRELGTYYEIRVLDYAEGVIRLDPADLIEQYNEAVNTQAEFSLHRVMDRFFSDTGVYEWHMENSGMLGVAGNIGFSTACHGYHTTIIVEDEDKANCVGDDALGADYRHPNDNIIPRISALGEIHPQKFSWLPPGDEGPMKYLKRSVERYTDNSMFLTPLFNLPLPPYLDMETGHRTVQPDQLSLENRQYRTAVSSGQLLDDIRKHELLVTDFDVYLATIYLKRAYQAVSLPFNGCLPGYRNQVTKSEISFCVPPIPDGSFKPQITDWLEECFSRISQPFVEIPILIDRMAVYKPSIGDSIEVPAYRFWTVLEDLGYIKLHRVFERVAVLSDENKRRLRKIVRGGTSKADRLIHVEVLDHIPERFDELFTRDPSLGEHVGLIDT